jgi:hypothetical protein
MAPIGSVGRNAPAPPIFLHSMWRTGSSYLLSRYAAEPQFLTFYEPFNGEITSRRLRERAKCDVIDRRATLRHPDGGTGYFDIFDRLDPATGRALWSSAHPRLTLFDVYNGLSDRGAALIEACLRVADADGRTAVFGFCHSGVQIAAMRERFGGDHVYLSRPARDQFISYDPTNNDFFMAATALQLISSEHWRRVALMLVPSLSKFAHPFAANFVKRAPHRLTMRFGRTVWHSLATADMYRIFYLSWVISNRIGRSDCRTDFSLSSLQSEMRVRRALEADHGITLDNLDYPASSPEALGIDFTGAEADVEHALQNFGDPV